MVDQTCDFLRTLSDACETGLIFWKYSPEIHQLLSSPESSSKIFALYEISKVSSHPDLLQNIELLSSVVNLIGNENLSVAKPAMDVLRNLGKTTKGLQTLYSGILLRSIAKVLSKDDVVKFRVYEVIVDIAKEGPEALDASVKSGFLQSLLSILDKDDVLVQLNALEIITELAMTQDGLDYLEDQGILQKLAQKIERIHEDVMAGLLIPGLMKFFGNVARLHPDDIFSKYPAVVAALFDVINTDDLTLLAIALDTLGHVASTTGGKYALDNFQNAMPKALKRIAEVIQKMTTQLKVCGLRNLSLILGVEKKDQDNRIVSLTKTWYDCLGDQPTKMILSFCQQPFADIREASLRLLSTIVEQIWGREAIAKHPGAIEFLLDRNVESFHECKLAKFEVVKRLTESEADIFEVQVMEKFRQFVREGPFYVEIPMEVAVEGGS